MSRFPFPWKAFTFGLKGLSTNNLIPKFCASICSNTQQLCLQLMQGDDLSLPDHTETPGKWPIIFFPTNNKK